MNPPTSPKILTVCEWGLVRSVCMRHWLIDNTYADVLAAGIAKNTPETLAHLAKWADLIILADKALLQHPNIWALQDPTKLAVYDVGRDVWQNSRHPDLRARVRHLMQPLANAIGRKKSD